MRQERCERPVSDVTVSPRSEQICTFFSLRPPTITPPCHNASSISNQVASVTFANGFLGQLSYILSCYTDHAPHWVQNGIRRLWLSGHLRPANNKVMMNQPMLSIITVAVLFTNYWLIVMERLIVLAIGLNIGNVSGLANRTHAHLHSLSSTLRFVTAQLGTCLFSMIFVHSPWGYSACFHQIVFSLLPQHQFPLQSLGNTILHYNEPSSSKSS
jgi:hypothetical protein